MSGNPDVDLDRLAGEHALGLLEGPEATQATALLETDPSFAARVARWQDHLVEIDAALAGRQAPNPVLWSRIQASLAATPVPPAEAAMEAGRPASAGRPPSPSRRRISPWPLATAAALAACLVLGLGLAHFARQAAQTPVLVAVLLQEGSSEPAAVVNTYRDGRAELVPLRDVVPSPGRSLQVWTLWDRGVGPRSLGVIERARPVKLDLSALPVPAPNQLFEITEEPLAGSPTGRPTGRIVMKGLAASVP